VRVVLLGPHGAGKGTQAARIAERFCIPHISTGDIFRENVKRGTQLGLQAQAYMDRGDLVPDDVVNRMVADRLVQEDTVHGWLLDGYPRTIPQAQTLEALLDQRGQSLDGVVSFEVVNDELAKRISGRAGQEHRSDDSGEAVERRLEKYFEKTVPLINFYREQGLLYDIDAVGAIDEVTRRIFAILERLETKVRGDEPRQA
jgi:adenylate kinase